MQRKKNTKKGAESVYKLLKTWLREHGIIPKLEEGSPEI
jgi:hypothetical protein